MALDLAGRDKQPRKRKGDCFSVNPLLYLLILGCVIIGTAGIKTGTESIFACEGEGYVADRYLAYCHTAGYGDYEHGAFWFGLEPSASASAASADVLFLGDSRMQHAFSTTTMSKWFASAAARYYLLGFGYSENSIFAAGLLARLRPRAKLYVINTDRFFDRRETVPAKTVMQGDGARIRYEIKRLWQVVHAPICANFPVICGNHYVVFRSREDGTYHPAGLIASKGEAVSYEKPAEDNIPQDEMAIAKEFLALLPVEHDCIILTLVPTVATKATSAAALAVDLGMQFVSPKLNDLQTFDGSHLDHASAERWSAAFLQAAAPRMRRCLSASADIRL
jgi:hypothetical protein